MFYFDNAATSFPKPESVYLAMDDCARSLSFNVGRGQYDLASKATSLVEKTREQILKFFDYQEGQVVFCPSATHAINTVLQGQLYNEGDTIYITPFEHNAIFRTLNHLSERVRLDIRYLSVSKTPFFFNLVDIRKQFEINPPKFLVISHASNVCGAITPIKELCSLAKEFGAITVVDTAQSAGHIPISMKEVMVDYLIFAGHKALLGPIGIGGIVMHVNDSHILPTVYGGTGYDSQNSFMPKELPARLEAGSLNIVAVAGLSAGLQWILDTGIEEIYNHEMYMMRKLQSLLENNYDFSCIGSDFQGPRLGVLSCISDEYAPDELGLILNKNSICVRTGLHCSPDAHRFFETFPSGTIRFSVGWFTSDADIEKLTSVIQKL